MVGGPAAPIMAPRRFSRHKCSPGYEPAPLPAWRRSSAGPSVLRLLLGLVLLAAPHPCAAQPQQQDAAGSAALGAGQQRPLPSSAAAFIPPRPVRGVPRPQFSMDETKAAVARGEPTALIVVYKESAVAAATAAGAATAAAADQVASSAPAGTPPARLRALAALKQRVLRAGPAAAAPGLEPADEALDHLPLSFVTVSSRETLEALEADPDVAAVVPNELLRPTLMNSLPMIGQPAAAAAGYAGAGCTVAVIDTGAFLSRKSAAEQRLNLCLWM